MPDLTSTANPRVKALVRLRGRRARSDAGATLVEGHDELALALDAGLVPTELYWAPDLVADTDLLPRVEALGTSVTSVNRAVFEKIAYREGADGWLAVAPSPGVDLADLVLGTRNMLPKQNKKIHSNC